MAEAHVRAEGAIAEVLDLLTQLREARGLGPRGRIAVQATRAMAALTPEQRRQLAVDVAKRAAPHLVDKIEADSDLDLSPAQVRAVVEMVGQLDRDDVESLRSSVQDPDWQRRAAARALGAANAVLDDAGLELEDAATADGPPPSTTADGEPSPPPADEPPAGSDQREVIDDGSVPGNAAAVDSASTTASLVNRTLGAAAAGAATVAARGESSPRPMARVEPPDGPREPPQPQVTPERFDPYEPGLPEMSRWRASGLHEDLFRFATGSSEDPPTEPRPTAAGTGDQPDRELSWFGGGSLDVAPVTPARTDLGERLRNVERAIEQLHVLLRAADEFEALTPGEQSSVLRQVRAAWVRRRVANALIADGRVDRASAKGVIEAFERPMDRAWIVASLVEAGVGPVADWAQLLSPAAAARLERRYAA